MQNIYRAELLAVALTAILKFVFVNFLGWKLFFILMIIACWCVYVWRRSRQEKEIWGRWGLSKRNAKKTIILLFPYALIIVFLFLLYAYFKNISLFNWHIIPILILYPIWGLIQQFLLIGLVVGNMKQMPAPFSDKIVVVCTAAILFGLIHYPFPYLMVATTLLAIVYALLFIRYQSLWALGLYHGILGGLFYFYVLNRDPWIEVFG